jgi:hypothetical protein
MMNKIPMLEKFAAQSLVYEDTGLDDGNELFFSKEKFAESIVAEMLQTCEDHPAWTGRMIGEEIKQRFGVEV